MPVLDHFLIFQHQLSVWDINFSVSECKQTANDTFHVTIHVNFKAYRQRLGGVQVVFGGNFVWKTAFRKGEYLYFMIYKWMIIIDHNKNKQLL